MECSGSFLGKFNHIPIFSFNPNCLMECSGRPGSKLGGEGGSKFQS